MSDSQPKGVRITHVRLVRPQSVDPNIGARVKYQGDRATGWKRIVGLYLDNQRRNQVTKSRPLESQFIPKPATVKIDPEHEKYAYLRWSLWRI